MRRSLTVDELEAAFRDGTANTVVVAEPTMRFGVVAPFGSKVAMGGRVWTLIEAGHGRVVLED